jgi:hypothetical protein
MSKKKIKHNDELIQIINLIIGISKNWLLIICLTSLFVLAGYFYNNLTKPTIKFYSELKIAYPKAINFSSSKFLDNYFLSPEIEKIYRDTLLSRNNFKKFISKSNKYKSLISKNIINQLITNFDTQFLLVKDDTYRLHFPDKINGQELILDYFNFSNIEASNKIFDSMIMQLNKIMSDHIENLNIAKEINLKEPLMLGSSGEIIFNLEYIPIYFNGSKVLKIIVEQLEKDRIELLEKKLINFETPIIDGPAPSVNVSIKKLNFMYIGLLVGLLFSIVLAGIREKIKSI